MFVFLDYYQLCQNRIASYLPRFGLMTTDGGPLLLETLPERKLDQTEGYLSYDSCEVATVEATCSLSSPRVSDYFQTGPCRTCLSPLFNDFHGNSDKTRRHLSGAGGGHVNCSAVLDTCICVT